MVCTEMASHLLKTKIIDDIIKLIAVFQMIIWTGSLCYNDKLLCDQKELD